MTSVSVFRRGKGDKLFPPFRYLTASLALLQDRRKSIMRRVLIRFRPFLNIFLKK